MIVDGTVRDGDVVTRPRSDVTTIVIGFRTGPEDVVTRPRSDVTTIEVRYDRAKALLL